MIRIKAWSASQAEPASWGFSVTDGTPSLRAPRAIGRQANASSNAVGSRTIRFDDLLADTVVPPTAVEAATLVGAGDTASCASQVDEAMAAVLDTISGTIFAAGDLAYENATAQEFSNCYDPTWGRHRSRTVPVPGNHDYHTSGAAGHFGYWGAAAGDLAKGYYAFDAGGWRVYVLNSECSRIGGCGADSPQETWLRADLAANLTDCTLAIMHRPRFSSGSEHGNDASVQPLWQALYDARTELVISGHDHNYERFNPQTPTGAASLLGITEFVVGTGCIGLRPIGTVKANSVVCQTTSHGVLSHPGRRCLSMAVPPRGWAAVHRRGRRHLLLINVCAAGQLTAGTTTP